MDVSSSVVVDRSVSLSVELSVKSRFIGRKAVLVSSSDDSDSVVVPIKSRLTGMIAVLVYSSDDSDSVVVPIKSRLTGGGATVVVIFCGAAVVVVSRF